MDDLKFEGDSWEEDLKYDISSDKGWNSSSDAETPNEHGNPFTPANEMSETSANENENLGGRGSSQELMCQVLGSSAYNFDPSAYNNMHLNITKYIPVGCLRIRKNLWSISSDYWMSCRTQWLAFNSPKDLSSSQNARYLSLSFQEMIMQQPDMQQTRALHDSAWIRMEFKSINETFGIVRVYVLPDDVARGEVPRFVLRRALTTLLNLLNLSKSAWSGQWHESHRIVTFSSPADDQDAQEPSLFQLFNELPSPNPQPDIVTDPYVQDAMYRILDNRVEGLSTTLYSYQQQSAAAMLQRETAPAQIIDPRLSVRTDHHGTRWYCDASAGAILREPKFYEAARGGICAETMGLGKTLICLAVILATKEISSKIPDEVLGHLPIRKTTGSLLEMAASNIGQAGHPWRHWLARLEAEGYELTNVRKALEKVPGHYLLHPPPPRRISRNPVNSIPRKMLLSSTTIVVVPPNLVQQWLREIEKHTAEGSLSILLMDDWKCDLPEAKELLRYDIILFSKPRFEYEARDEQANDEEENGSAAKRGSKKRPPIAGGVRYHSPLKDIHFKRLIIDEGHQFGNASKTSKTEATIVVDFLCLSARWIISGTPTKGLYGSEVVSAKCWRPTNNPRSKPSRSSDRCIRTGPSRSDKVPPFDISESPASSLERLHALERKDIEKLGNIATTFLKLRPWSHSPDDGDTASWSQYVMQPRHGSKSMGNLECLKTTLEGMIIRHQPQDINKDVTLPPLHHDFVYLDGSLQSKLSLNTFVMMIITNAVTSERKDADYFFHHRQRKNLLQLVSNLRQSSFFWSGFETEHIQSTVNNAKKFLEERKVPVTVEDESLLTEAIRIGETVLANNICQLISKSHEMPMYIDNQWDEDVRRAWALDRDTCNPTLIGATFVHATQKFVKSQLYRSDPMEGLAEAGTKVMEGAFETQASQPANSTLVQRGSSLKRPRPVDIVPELAGGVTVGDGSSSRKKSRASVSASKKTPTSSDLLIDARPPTSKAAQSLMQTDLDVGLNPDTPAQSTIEPSKSALKRSSMGISATLDPNSPFTSASIISTASVKLSYLMDKIIAHQKEKTIVFYESDNVAYYIAQALECLGIKHLIYAKSLHSSRRAKYVVTFNQTETFRVLLMDISHAAFGLDLSSASRVFFVNPVFSPQVEAQAVKRAHRIGQVRPVYVETLVLKGSIEEVILERRQAMTEQEHQKCKTILDDQTMYDWIRNVRFLDVPSESVPGPEQFAPLENRQALFTLSSFTSDVADPDADLVGDSKPRKSPKSKKAKVAFAVKEDD